MYSWESAMAGGYQPRTSTLSSPATSQWQQLRPHTISPPPPPRFRPPDPFPLHPPAPFLSSFSSSFNSISASCRAGQHGILGLNSATACCQVHQAIRSFSLLFLPRRSLVLLCFFCTLCYEFFVHVLYCLLLHILFFYRFATYIVLKLECRQTAANVFSAAWATR